MTRVAIYVRVSTHDQAEDGYSIDEQVDRLEAYCKSRNWQVSKVYKDAGFSGSNIDRPALTQLVREIKNFDLVLVYKLDRLSRSQKDTIHLVEDVFIASGVDFISVSENFDTSSPFGKAMVGILSVFAQLEREQIRERMMMGMLGRIKSGKPSAWSNVPFGYDYTNGELIINEVQAPVVRNMFETYLSGVSITKMIELLNDQGHIGKSIPWSYRTVRHILSNAVYAGLTNFRGEKYQGNHEAIIDLAVYEKTQSELLRRQQEAYAKNNNPRPFQAKYLLSGLLRCGRCGSGFELNQGNKRKDGTRSKRYKCYSQTPSCRGRGWKKAKYCDNKVYDVYELEDLVFAQVEQLRLNPDSLLSQPAVDNSKEKEALSSELDTIMNKLDRLINLYVDGRTPLELLNKKRESLEAQRLGIITRIDKLNESTPNLAIEEARALLATVLTDIRYVNEEDQKNIVRSLIEKITLDMDEMTIKWRFT